MTPADEIALLGNQKTEVLILGRKFKIRTLDSDEEGTANAAAAVWDPETKKQILKIEKLARAIESIDGASFSVSKEEADQGLSSSGKARKAIYKWQRPVVERVYSELEKLEEMREQSLREIEKNGMSPLIASGAGK
jgi:hypothetical protein